MLDGKRGVNLVSDPGQVDHCGHDERQAAETDAHEHKIDLADVMPAGLHTKSTQDIHGKLSCVPRPEERKERWTACVRVFLAWSAMTKARRCR